MHKAPQFVRDSHWLVVRKRTSRLTGRPSWCCRILIYTGIQTLPVWANETFMQLEYLCVHELMRS